MFTTHRQPITDVAWFCWAVLAGLSVVFLVTSPGPEARYRIAAAKFDRESDKLRSLAPDWQALGRFALRETFKSTNGRYPSDTDAEWIAFSERFMAPGSRESEIYASVFNAIPSIKAYRKQVDRVEDAQRAVDDAQAAWRKRPTSTNRPTPNAASPS
jgi:hypothetical protein